MGQQKCYKYLDPGDKEKLNHPLYCVVIFETAGHRRS